MIEIPNSYGELTLSDRPAILKLHGQVDRRPERDHELLVSEDDYIGYLAQAEIANVVPVTLAAKLRRSHFLLPRLRARRVAPASLPAQGLGRPAGGIPVVGDPAQPRAR